MKTRKKESLVRVLSLCKGTIQSSKDEEESFFLSLAQNELTAMEL